MVVFGRVRPVRILSLFVSRIGLKKGSFAGDIVVIRSFAFSTLSLTGCARGSCMSLVLRCFALSVISLSISIQTLPVLAGTLEGSVSSEGQSSGIVLQGGIKDDAPLQSSIKVIREKEDPKAGRPRAEIPRRDNDADDGPVQYPLQPGSGTPGSGRGVGGVIPPISTYTETSSSSALRTAPRRVEGPPSVRGVTSYVPGQEVNKVTTTSSSGGLFRQNRNTWSTSELSFQSSKRVQEDTSIGLRGALLGSGQRWLAPLSRAGVTSYDSSYEANIVTGSESNFSKSLSTSFNRRVESSSTPPYRVSISAPRNGIVCWEPGYEVTAVSRGLRKETIGGLYFVPANDFVTPLKATPNTLKPDRIYAQPIVMLDHPLRATAGGAYGTSCGGGGAWDEWYNDIAKAIYRRWQNAEVGPGIAKVRVLVRERKMYTQLTEFVPAPFVDRDTVAESQFRTSALAAVNDVSYYEIPEFPALPERSTVTFDAVLNRTVDGPLGCEVSARN